MLHLKWVWENMKGVRKWFILGICISAISETAIIINPKLSQMLIDKVLTGGQHALLLPLLGGMLAVTLARNGMRYGMIMSMEKSSQTMLLRLRKYIFDHLQWLGENFYRETRTGDLMTRVTGDMDYIRYVVAFDTYAMTDSIFLFTASIVFLMFVNWALTLTLMVVVPALAILGVYYSKTVHPLFRALRERLSALNTTAQENIAGNRVVRAFARESYEIEKFDESNQLYRQASVRANVTWQKINQVIQFISQSMTVITVLVGGLFIIRGTLTFGGLMAFTSLTWALADPMSNFGGILNDFQRFFVSADKVMEIYYAKPEIVDDEHPQNTEERLTGQIDFDNVSFAYGKEKILDHVSFSIRPGETVAIMGPTGAGKTSLINLIARFMDVTSGEVRLDGVDVRRWKLSTLRRSIGLTTQDVFLFSDTIDGNIAYGDPEMSEERVKTCARAAAADFIDKMPDGYDTIVGERGVGLSGGQRQRIALARALAIAPPVLILDDTTSAVDMETEEYIQDSLRHLDFPCTKIIVAQRISSVRDADRIMILQDGKIEQGTHDELIRRPGYYRDVCGLQDYILPDITD